MFQLWPGYTQLEVELDCLMAVRLSGLGCTFRHSNTVMAPVERAMTVLGVTNAFLHLQK